MKGKVYDLGTIESITGGKPDRILNYINMYIEQGSEEITQLKGFFEEENWEEFERTAHKMKAGSGYMGITELKRVAAEIEVKGAEQNRDKETLSHQIRLAGEIFESAKIELLEEKKRLEAIIG